MNKQMKNNAILLLLLVLSLASANIHVKQINYPNPTQHYHHGRVVHKTQHHKHHSHPRRLKSVSQMHSQENKDVFRSSNGVHLRNHYGYPSNDSPYGAVDQVDIKRLMFKNKDGSWTKVVNPNLKAGDLIGESCDIKQSSYYDHCRVISTCQECNANEGICSWCPGDQKCNPAVKEGCSCPFICPYSFEPNHACDASLRVFGEIKHVAPDSNGMRSPEIAKAKMHHHTRTTTVVPSEAKFQVGTTQQRVKMALHKTGHNKEFNQLSNEWVTQTVPVYHTMPISKLQDSETDRYYDALTNEEIHEAKHHEKKILHGIDNTKKIKKVTPQAKPDPTPSTMPLLPSTLPSTAPPALEDN